MLDHEKHIPGNQTKNKKVRKKMVPESLSTPGGQAKKQTKLAVEEAANLVDAVRKKNE